MIRAVLTFPVLPGKSEVDIRKIADRFKADPQAYRDSRRRAGVTLERAYWQHTPMGDFVVAYAESNKNTVAETLQAMAQGSTDLDRFFIEAVKEVHGIDITSRPLVPLRRRSASGSIPTSSSASGAWLSALP